MWFATKKKKIRILVLNTFVFKNLLTHCGFQTFAFKLVVGCLCLETASPGLDRIPKAGSPMMAAPRKLDSYDQNGTPMIISEAIYLLVYIT